jgi:hypothetical protein
VEMKNTNECPTLNIRKGVKKGCISVIEKDVPDLIKPPPIYFAFSNWNEDECITVMQKLAAKIRECDQRNNDDKYNKQMRRMFVEMFYKVLNAYTRIEEGRKDVRRRESIAFIMRETDKIIEERYRRIALERALKVSQNEM